MKRNGKKWLVILIILTLIAGIGCGVWYYLGHNQSEPVYVYDFFMVGMTEFWGDNQESYGPVKSDRVQTVYVSDSQTITECLVSEGDTVKKGDLLLSFDTTLSDLSVERKRLEVEKLKLDLDDANKKLEDIKLLKPHVDPPAVNFPDYSDMVPDDGSVIPKFEPGSCLFRNDGINHDGKTRETAMICWVHSGTELNSSLFTWLGRLAAYYQSEAFESSKLESASAAAEQEAIPFYVVFKETAGNKSKGSTTLWQGMYVNPLDNTSSFFNAGSVGDCTYIEPDPVEFEIPNTNYYFDTGSSYTAEEIFEMREKQEKVVHDLELKIKMTDADYKVMQAELQDGKVYAKIDGLVTSLMDEEEARLKNQPMLKISGGGGYYIEGSVSEFVKNDSLIGQEVTVMDYRSGMSYSGEIRELSNYPTKENGFSGMGNPNASYYPFTVFVDDSADLMEGMYVSVQYSLSDSQNGVYLENPFVRTENGKSYVFVQGEDGKLEQRFVTTGKSLWGSYTEILDGLTADDKVAFPYGKNVKPGVQVIPGDYSNLYG